MQERRKHPYISGREPEIRMVWHITSPPPPIPNLPSDYRLRQVRQDETEAYEELAVLAWPLEDFWGGYFEDALPGGFFAVEHLPSGQLFSSCMAMKPGVFKEYSDVGTLGWLVTDPAHGGLGLATTVVLAVMNRLMAEGYRESYLGTEDERLAAIHIYLKLGWQPLMYTDGMEERWQSIKAQLQTSGRSSASSI
jgi:RimJ/RimL family protein N-acetyltransferase